jgi:tartrate dehydratase alpha subunit/fumarate hydratase class I-like protein
LGSITMGGKLVHMVESPNQNNEVEDVIQHGVIETFDETHHRRREVVRTIRDGIKQTCAQIPSIDAVVERVVEEGIKQTIGEEYHHRSRIDSVIKNSIKEVQPLPAQDGNMDYSNYYYRQGDRTKPHTQYVNDVIENSIKETIL